MNLYEVVNGYYGYAYTRVYVWAESKEKALKLAAATFKEHGDSYGSHYWSSLECRLLFTSTAKPFTTIPSDVGWVARDS